MIEEVSTRVTLVQAPGYSLIGLAAKFCTDPSTYAEILAKYTQEELDQVGLNAIGMGHLAISEFDDYVFAIEGVSRTFTHQLVRKRIAMYAQESMRFTSQAGKYQIVIPESVRDKSVPVSIRGTNMMFTIQDFAFLANQMYEGLQKKDVPNEDARFVLLEASKTKILVKMNVHSLIDFFKVRTCTCAQWEIRAAAVEMLRLCKIANPAVFANVGATCQEYGMCKESRKKHDMCRRMPHIKDVIAGQDRPFWGQS